MFKITIAPLSVIAIAALPGAALMYALGEMMDGGFFSFRAVGYFLGLHEFVVFIAAYVLLDFFELRGKRSISRSNYRRHTWVSLLCATAAAVFGAPMPVMIGIL